jgi:hypothetical protein
MKREYLDQLAVWFHAEVEGFKAKYVESISQPLNRAAS